MLKEIAEMLARVTDADLVTHKPTEVAPNHGHATQILMPLNDEWRRYYVAMRMASERDEERAMKELCGMYRAALLPMVPAFQLLLDDSLPEGMTYKQLHGELRTASDTAQQHLAAHSFGQPDEIDRMLVWRFKSDLQLALNGCLRGKPAHQDFVLGRLNYGVFLADADGDEWVVAVKDCPCSGCRVPSPADTEQPGVPDHFKQFMVQRVLDHVLGKTGGTLLDAGALPDGLPEADAAFLKMNLEQGDYAIDLGDGKTPRFMVLKAAVVDTGALLEDAVKKFHDQLMDPAG